VTELEPGHVIRFGPGAAGVDPGVYVILSDPTKPGRPQKNAETVSAFTEDTAAKTGAGPGIAANLGLYAST